MVDRGLPEKIRSQSVRPPRFTVVIACRPAASIERALSSVLRAELDPGRLEIRVARGLNPSAQRNAAARAALGDYLLFLDDDSEVIPAIFSEYERALSSFPGAQIVGGPALHEAAPGNRFQEALLLAFQSLFWVGPVRGRYQARGKTRTASEKELILCNLLVQREFFLERQGFDPEFYPNEENEFLNRIFGQALCVHHPDALCKRRPRETWRALASQLFRYGRGRGQQWRKNGKKNARTLLFGLPALFASYAVLSVLLIFVVPMLALPLGAYFVTGAAISLWLSRTRPALAPLLFGSFFVFHFFYGLGWIGGVIGSPLRRQSAISEPAIELELLKGFEVAPNEVLRREALV